MTQRSHGRRPGIAGFCLTILVASCADGGIGSGLQGRTPGASPGAASPAVSAKSPGQSSLGGGVGDSGGLAAPTPTAPPAGQASPSAAPAVEAQSVQILPLSVAPISVPPGVGPGAESGKPTAVQLSAMVTFTDGSTSSAVLWSTLDEAVASVTASGLVAALAPGPGKGPWAVGIRASSPDGKATALRYVTVNAAGSVAISVQ